MEDLKKNEKQIFFCLNEEIESFKKNEKIDVLLNERTKKMEI